ncbi:MAG: hypothetical protein WEB33_13195 [Bacteroidota bacterium]
MKDPIKLARRIFLVAGIPPAVLVLYLQGRLPDSFFPLAVIDALFGASFVLAYIKTKQTELS